MNKKERLEKIFRMRVGQAEIPDWQFRKYLLLFFVSAAFVFLWTPTRWLIRSWHDFKTFDGLTAPDLSPAVPALGGASGLPGEALLSRDTDRGATAAKTPRAVVFRLLAPAAKSVFLGGSFNGFDARKHALSRRPDGVWEITLDLTPGRYLYKFKVDGRWELDPTNPDKTPQPRSSSILAIQ
ncbi:MAG TPA: glycogen-binding domain-containing protein [Elusimicrobiota bacterium]|nr:glycogen-binding domain-containing protein [Elusimicrobiota bacterium]